MEPSTPRKQFSGPAATTGGSFRLDWHLAFLSSPAPQASQPLGSPPLGSPYQLWVERSVLVSPDKAH